MFSSARSMLTWHKSSKTNFKKMGIPGFTKFINDRAHLYFENHELRDCTLIIDGHSLSCQLYNWKHWQFDARSHNSYGGDYDKYAYIVENFFGMLKKVKVKPIVVFDGGFEQRKLPTILKRMQDKINIADKLDPEFESKQPNRVVFPLFLREAFKDTLRNLDVKMIMCEYEADTEIASIAKSLNCPVLTFDSDFYLFGVQYIPFTTLDSRVCAIENWRTGTYKCIYCKMYHIEKVLDSFQGLQENTLHILPVLLGNDYINPILFTKFLQSIKANNVSLQDRIQHILEWLKTETAEGAIKKILTSFSTVKERLFILNKIEKIVTSYYFVETKVFRYLNIESHQDIKCKRINFDILRETIEQDTQVAESELTIESNLSQIDNKDCELDSQEYNSEISGKEQSNASIKTLQVMDRETRERLEEKLTSMNENKSPENGIHDSKKQCNLENPEEGISDASINIPGPHEAENKTDELQENSISSCRSTNEDKSSENGIHDKILENGAVQIQEINKNSNEENEDKDVDEDNPFTLPLSFEETNLEKENTSKNPVSKLFRKNFTRCLYPSSFMDIITQNTYYCIPQIENHCEQNSHLFSFDILRAIHRILTSSSTSDFTIVGRSEGTKIEWYLQPKYTVSVPSLEEIELLPLQGRRDILFSVLSIDSDFVSLLEHFPTEWHTFLVALKYAASKTTFETPLIYSLILGFIILNYIDQRIGYYRSAKAYEKKYYSYMQNAPPVHDHIPFRADKNCFYYFPQMDCVIFVQKIIYLFSMNLKENSETFDKHLVHQMAQIQSVLLHIKYLNALLKNPYPNLMIHQIFDATFIYNLTKTFKEKSTELENNYLNVFFKDCPTILAGLKYVLNMLNKQIIF